MNHLPGVHILLLPGLPAIQDLLVLQVPAALQGRADQAHPHLHLHPGPETVAPVTEGKYKIQL